MFADVRHLQTLYNDITPTVSKFWEGPGECVCEGPCCRCVASPAAVALSRS